MKKSLIILIGFTLLTFTSKSQLTYSSSNFYFFTGLEFGTYEMQTNTFLYDEFLQQIYEPKEFNSVQSRIGFGYNYNRTAKFSFGFEAVAGIGMKKENTFKYYSDLANEMLSYQAQDKIDYIELGYLLDFAIIGDLEESDFTLCISPLFGFQGARYVSEREGELQGNVDNRGYESLIHLNSENGIAKERIVSAFIKIGPSFQYGISKYWLIYGSTKYTFAYSSSSNDYIKRNNWFNLDLGMKIILN